MDYLDPGSIMQVLLSVGGPVIGAVYTFFATKSARADKALAELDRRISAIENDMRHLPSKDAVTDLKLAIADLKGTVGRLEERLAPISSTVNHIDTFLREGSSAP